MCACVCACVSDRNGPLTAPRGRHSVRKMRVKVCVNKVSRHVSFRVGGNQEPAECFSNVFVPKLFKNVTTFKGGFQIFPTGFVSPHALFNAAADAIILQQLQHRL